MGNKQRRVLHRLKHSRIFRERAIVRFRIGGNARKLVVQVREQLRALRNENRIRVRFEIE